MKLSLLLAGAGIASGLILAWHRKRQQDHVSDRWLDESYRRGLYNTFEGVSWKWPINKGVNEAAHFNAKRLRKRA